MNPINTLAITKACEFLLEPHETLTTLEMYEALLKCNSVSPEVYTTNIRPEFKHYTAGEMVLIINELANKFKEVYRIGCDNGLIGGNNEGFNDN
jgi:hypothetical protein